MGAQTSSSAESETSATPANDGGQEGAEAQVSASGEHDPDPDPVPVPQQQERQVVLHGPATLNQCHQLFGATCQVQLHRCQIPDAPAPGNSDGDATPSSSEASADSSHVSKVKEEEDSSFCEEVPSAPSGARKLVEYSDSGSDTSDEDIKVFAYSPAAAAASTKKRPVSAPAVSQVKWEDSSDPEESEEELKFFPASTAVRKKKTGKGVSRRKSSFPCTVCKKIFSKKSYLRIHMPKHTGEKRYKCEMCGRSFCYKSSLYTHKKIRDQRNGVCPCPRKTKIWRPERSWTCNICGERMNTASSYKVHKRGHRGEKPFKCGQCGKAWRSRSELSVHSRIHSGVWQFSCVFCNKGFHFKHDFFQHLRLHTEEKPYFCKVKGCGASFRLLRSLKNHRRRIHF